MEYDYKNRVIKEAVLDDNARSPYSANGKGSESYQVMTYHDDPDYLAGKYMEETIP